MKPRTHFLTILLCLAPLGAAGQHPMTNTDDPAIAEFNRQVGGYVELRRTIEGTVPAIKVSANPAEIGAAVETLGESIRKARSDAREGDIFVPAAAGIFRRIIREQYQTRFRELLQMTHEDTPPLTRPVVNGPWSGAAYTFMPPDLLSRFPRLPVGLQYRFVNRDLVLWDSHANVILDILRNAIPEQT